MRGVRRRYLALEVEAVGAMVDSREFMDAVWGAVVRLYGEYGASKTGLSLIDYDVEKGFVVIRSVHLAVDMVRVALASLTEVEGKCVAVHVLAVSGTIRGLYRRLGKVRR